MFSGGGWDLEPVFSAIGGRAVRENFDRRNARPPVASLPAGNRVK